MGRKKLQKFTDNENNEKVIQEGKNLFTTVKGNWHNTVFDNNNPIVLELGCGRGEYTVGLAQHYPDKNFIGVDIKGSRLWTGSQQAKRDELENVAFLRTEIRYINDFFKAGEVSEIWITFPDPHPKEKAENNRLTSPIFLERYKQFLQPGGLLHLKTDNSGLFVYTLEMLNKAGHHIYDHTWDLYHSPMKDDHYGLKTRYEEKFVREKGRRIKYVKFTLAL